MSYIDQAAKAFRQYEGEHRAKADKHREADMFLSGNMKHLSADTALQRAEVNREYAQHMEKLSHSLRAVHEVAMAPGNAHADHYMRGIANGLELAMSIVDGREPAYVLPEVVAPSTGFERVKAFHEAFSLPVNAPGYVPTVEERLLRGRLLLEEALEHLLSGLGLVLVWQDSAEPTDEYYASAEDWKSGEVKLLLRHEGGNYDPVETLDGLCDVKVIANGTGVAFGLPVPAADELVFKSNMSKLGADGKPIINGVTPGYTENGQDGLHEPGFRPDLPIGKVLKPDTFVPVDIAGLISSQLEPEFIGTHTER